MESGKRRAGVSGFWSCTIAWPVESLMRVLRLGCRFTEIPKHRVAVFAGLALALAVQSYAQSEPPQESIERVQEMYARLHQNLWEVDDYFWHQGEYERCIATLRLITTFDPWDTEAYSGGAWLMQNQLRDDEAEAYLLEGLASNHDSFSLYFELGYFYYMRSRFAEAIANLENAVAFDETPQFVWNLLAHSYEHAGRTSEALNIWAAVESLDPTHVVPQNQIERILEGGPPSEGPESARRSREQRMRDKLHEHEH